MPHNHSSQPEISVSSFYGGEFYFWHDHVWNPSLLYIFTKTSHFLLKKEKSHLFFCPAILISSELSKCFLWRWPGSIWCPLQLLSSFAPITPHTWHLKATPHNWTQISLKPPLWTWSTVSRVDGLALSRWRHAPSRSTLPHHARSALSAVCCV